jgi:transmembrane sensor
MHDERDLMQKIARASAHIDPGLSDRDVERLVSGTRIRRRRRLLGRIGLAALSVAFASGICALLFFDRLPSGSLPVVEQTPAPTETSDRVLRLGDGSIATPMDMDSEIEVTESSKTRIRLNMRRGRGHFAVTPNVQRIFSVRAGDVTVTVLGTRFTVERIADRVGISVEQGTVRVEWVVGAKQLTKGESGWFPPLAVAVPEDSKPLRSLHPRAAPKNVASVEEKPVASPVQTRAGELLAAADAARLAGKPSEGAAILRRLLQGHRQDPRAPLAAFTLGRMLLMELGRPQEAAAAFAEARQIAPKGSFAEDALAREVEAWSRAGKNDLARLRAKEYLRLYPDGLRVSMIRALGGIE